MSVCVQLTSDSRLLSSFSPLEYDFHPRFAWCNETFSASHSYIECVSEAVSAMYFVYFPIFPPWNLKNVECLNGSS
jgi:hypothetical protein